MIDYQYLRPDHPKILSKVEKSCLPFDETDFPVIIVFPLLLEKYRSRHAGLAGIQ